MNNPLIAPEYSGGKQDVGNLSENNTRTTKGGENHTRTTHGKRTPERHRTLVWPDMTERDTVSCLGHPPFEGAAFEDQHL